MERGNKDEEKEAKEVESRVSRGRRKEVGGQRDKGHHMDCLCNCIFE